MGLFAPRWQSADEKKSWQWLEKYINDTDQIVQAALQSPFPEIKKAAVDRINDQNVLEELTLQYCKYAIAKLNNKDFLSRLFTDTYTMFRKTDERLDEEAERAYIRAGSPISKEESHKIFGKYTDLKETKHEVAELAWERLKEIGDINDFWNLCGTKEIKFIFAYKWQSEAAELWFGLCGHTPKEIVLNSDYTDFIRLTALSKIDDQVFLAEFGEDALQRNPKDEVALKALCYVTDPVKRRSYCERFGLHYFEYVTKTEEYDRDYEYCEVTKYYRCKYCGKEKIE